MSIRRVYVSGPMTGLPDFNYPAFQATTSRLRAAGLEVVCPTEIGDQPDTAIGDPTWTDYIRADLRAILDVDAIVCLPGWLRSKGATLECHVATALGLPLYSADELLEEIAA